VAGLARDLAVDRVAQVQPQLLPGGDAGNGFQVGVPAVVAERRLLSERERRIETDLGHRR
jgi:hypothetical protein